MGLLEGIFSSWFSLCYLCFSKDLQASMFTRGVTMIGTCGSPRHCGHTHLSASTDLGRLFSYIKTTTRRCDRCFLLTIAILLIVTISCWHSQSSLLCSDNPMYIVCDAFAVLDVQRCFQQEYSPQEGHLVCTDFLMQDCVRSYSTQFARMCPASGANVWFTIWVISFAYRDIYCWFLLYNVPF